MSEKFDIHCLECNSIYSEKEEIVKICPHCGNENMERTVYISKANQNRHVYIFDDGDIYGIKSVNVDDNNKTITFIYEQFEDKNTFTENVFCDIIKNYPKYNLYALEQDGNYFTDTTKINLVDDDSMNDRIDLNIS